MPEPEEVKEEVARLNAEAVLGRIDLWEKELREALTANRAEVVALTERLNHLEGRFIVEQQLRAAMAGGSGPTA